MEYKIVLEYDFIGSYGQKDYLVGNLIKRYNQDLPIGFRIASEYLYGGFWQREAKNNKRLMIILLITAIIYLICAVLLEDLLQPLAVILMIPLTFIGVFLSFYLFKIPFDDGGYASLLLLSGLTVNAALYVVNDYNNLKKGHMPVKNDTQQMFAENTLKHRSWFRQRFVSKKVMDKGLTRLYLKAFNHKIIPIVLTILSTILGFAPFLIGGKKEPFWFGLATGTMGGLLFSLLALYIYLPLLLRLERRKSRIKFTKRFKN